MITSIDVLNEQQTRVITENKGQERTIMVSIGSKYIIEPTNPQKTKNSGRKCEVIEFKQDEYGFYASVSPILGYGTARTRRL